MLLERVISGIVLGLIALAVVLLGGETLGLTLLLVSLIAFFEINRALKPEDMRRHISALEILGYIEIIVYYFMILLSTEEVYIMISTIVFFLLLLLIYVLTFPRYHYREIMQVLFAFTYAPVMFSFMYMTRHMPYGRYVVWLIFIGAWISDTSAFAVGIAFGKHKLAPRLSPKKTVEGAIGGILGAVVVGGLYGNYIASGISEVDHIIWVFALIGGMGSVFSQIGDLAASAIKRNANIKDYGNIIPGHGGIMDRFDSIVITSPLIYILAVVLMNIY